MLRAVEIYKMLLDGSQWGRWSGFHLPVNSTCATIWTPIGTPMHWRPATWHTETHNIAFFWPGRWYVINVKYTAEGQFAGCYCDIVTPNPPLRDEDGEVRYTDLYVDVVVTADKRVTTKDEEVYDRAMQHLPELVALRDQSFAELAALAAHARGWTGPFCAIPDRLQVTNWETLEPASAAFSVAAQRQWEGLAWQE